MVLILPSSLGLWWFCGSRERAIAIAERGSHKWHSSTEKHQVRLFHLTREEYGGKKMHDPITDLLKLMLINIPNNTCE